MLRVRNASPIYSTLPDPLVQTRFAPWKPPDPRMFTPSALHEPDRLMAPDPLMSAVKSSPDNADTATVLLPDISTRVRLAAVIV